MFYDNFIMYCNRIGKSPSFAAVEMGFHRSEVTRWSKGVMPRRANLQRMATYFGCTIEDLLIEKTAANTGDGLTDAQRQLLQLIHLLDDADISVLLATAQSLIASRRSRDAE